MGQIKTTHAGHGGNKTNGHWADPGAVGNGYNEDRYPSLNLVLSYRKLT